MWPLLLAQPILLGDDTTLCVLLRDGLDEEHLAKLERRKPLSPALDAGLPASTGPPGSATSYAWLYTGLDGLAPYNVFHWSLTHQNAVIDGHLATYRGIFVGDACGANARLQQRSGRTDRARQLAMRTPGANSSRPSRTIRSWRRRRFRSTASCTMSKNAARPWMPRHAEQLRQREAVPIWNRMRLWLDGDAAKRALPRSRDRRSAGLSAEPVVGTDGVLERRADSDRQRPIGADRFGH